MPKQLSRAEAFAHFNVKVKNSRWSWSARSEDGKTIVLTLWQDELKKGDNNTFVYHAKTRGDHAEWIKRPGNRERLENLKWAKEHCNGLFRVVVAIAEDVTAVPREIKECFPHPNLTMKIVELNEDTGEFRAVSV